MRPRHRTSARIRCPGKEQSGPLAATADLFEGRPWVLTPTRRHRHRGAQPRAGTGRAVPCRPRGDGRRRARPRGRPRLAHPAAGLQHGRRPPGGRRRDGGTAVRPGHPRRDPDRGLRPARCGSRSSSANPGPVADVLAEVAARPGRDGTGAAGAAVGRRGEAAAAAPPASRTYCAAATPAGPGCPASTARPRPPTDRGGPHQRPPGRAGADLRRRRAGPGVNIEDVRIEHATGQQAGLVQLMVEPSAAPVLTAALRERGWSIRRQ